MNRAERIRYRVENLDCAACAAKIEQGLKDTEGVDEAVLDFASLTLHLKTRDVPKALATVSRIEPQVKLSPKSHRGDAAEAGGSNAGPHLGRELAIIAVAALMLVTLLIFEDQFHQLPQTWIEYAFAGAAYLLAGWKVFSGALCTIRQRAFFDENVLMVIATLGAMAIHALPEAVAVMLFFKIGELLQELAVTRSRRSVRGLLAVRPNKATLKRAGGLVDLRPEEVRVGDILLVKPGEKVPLDGDVIQGVSRVDTAALTGEPVPVRVAPGSPVLAGVINTVSALTIRVSKPFEESSIARMLDLVENAAARKAKTEKFITVFARYYTPVVVGMAVLIATVPPLVFAAASFSDWLYRALVLLVISCPCALVVSIPLSYFGGIGRASRKGILVKGSMFIDALAKINTVVFDKTGTLTRGVFELDRVVTLNGFSADQVLQYAAAAELHAEHPIAGAIVGAARARGLDLPEGQVGDHEALSGMGVRATYAGRRVTVGNDALLHREAIAHGRCVFESTVAHVVIDGEYAGYLLIGDQLKPDAVQAVADLRKNGVENVVMLTGDNACAAGQVAGALNLDRFYADLLPEDKVHRFEQICAETREGGTVAFVGDGINDAPVLARADVGMAMGGLGSDAAIESADVVLMTDAPMKVTTSIRIARATQRIIVQNIVLALTIKAAFVLMGIFGLASMWAAVFADMGTTLIAVANATRLSDRLSDRVGDRVGDRAPLRAGAH
jgi:Zn2+/Cd2+-exporting ATPase